MQNPKMWLKPLISWVVSYIWWDGYLKRGNSSRTPTLHPKWCQQDVGGCVSGLCCVITHVWKWGGASCGQRPPTERTRKCTLITHHMERQLGASLVAPPHQASNHGPPHTPQPQTTHACKLDSSLTITTSQQSIRLSQRMGHPSNTQKKEKKNTPQRHKKHKNKNQTLEDHGPNPQQPEIETCLAWCCITSQEYNRCLLAFNTTLMLPPHDRVAVLEEISLTTHWVAFCHINYLSLLPT